MGKIREHRAWEMAFLEKRTSERRGGEQPDHKSRSVWDDKATFLDFGGNLHQEVIKEYDVRTAYGTDECHDYGEKPTTKLLSCKNETNTPQRRRKKSTVRRRNGLEEAVYNFRDTSHVCIWKLDQLSKL